jgi:hypothetical protein
MASTRIPAFISKVGLKGRCDACHLPLTVEVSFEFAGEWTDPHTFVMESTSKPVLTIVDAQGNPLPGCPHCSADMGEKFEEIAKLMEGKKSDGI